jgi:putative NADH-flavin reductase
MAHILVVGASRGIGLETVKAALTAGHTVRALARTASDMGIDNPSLDKMAGDATSEATLEHALQGIDAVIMTLGVAPGASTMVSGTRLFSTATRALIDAMKKTEVRRVVVVTGIGAGDSRGHGGAFYDWFFFPLLLQRVYDDKDVQERMVRNSGLDWTIVRPGLLTNGPFTGSYRVLVDPMTWHAASISRADVADFLVKEACCDFVTASGWHPAAAPFFTFLSFQAPSACRLK